MHCDNTLNLRTGLNFTDGAHNPELVMDPVERAQVPGNLFGEFVESIVTAPNVGRPFNKTYTPHGGGPGYQVPDNAGVNLTIAAAGRSDKGKDRIRISGSNGTHLTYEQR